MAGVRALLFSGLTVIAVACQPFTEPVPVSDGVPQIGVNYDTANWRQSETALVASQIPFFKILATFYNDFSVSNVDPKYTPNPDRWKRGYSALGYSTSADIGANWDYRGEILAPQNGDGGWPAIGADPSAVTDPNSQTDVYVVVLAVSDAAWNTVAINDESPVFPVALSDSFCVAASHNGGLSFPEIGCQVVSRKLNGTANPGGADRTAITVDGFGRIWVSIAEIPEDAGGNANEGFLQVWHTPTASVLNGFIRSDPPQRNIRQQILRHDQNGDVWFGGLETQDPSKLPGNLDPGVWLQKFDRLSNAWVLSKNVSASCGLTVANDQQIPLNPVAMTPYRLRNAHVYDFDVGLKEPPFPGAGQTEVIRLAFQQQRKDARRFIQVAEVDTSLASCRTNVATSSTRQDAGSQFMPSMHYQLRDTAPTWQVVYLNTQNVIDPTGPYAYPTAVQPSTFPNKMFPVLTLPADLAPPDWSTCTDFAHDNYWGDYFGLTQIKDYQGTWWGVSTFTSSRPNPAACMGAEPQHVAANRW